jgi:hypothetical protein
MMSRNIYIKNRKQNNKIYMRVENILKGRRRNGERIEEENEFRTELTHRCEIGT